MYFLMVGRWLALAVSLGVGWLFRPPGVVVVGVVAGVNLIFGVAGQYEAHSFLSLARARRFSNESVLGASMQMPP